MHVMLQAYHEMADFNTKQALGTMLTSKHIVSEPPESLKEKLRRPIKKLKGLVEGAALTELSPIIDVNDMLFFHGRPRLYSI